MNKWEYLVEEIDASCLHPKSQTMELNWKGLEGWELVNILHVDGRDYAYFKRKCKKVYNTPSINLVLDKSYGELYEEVKKEFDTMKAAE